MIGDEAAVRTSYETFLDLWKNAGPDIRIYQQAEPSTPISNNKLHMLTTSGLSPAAVPEFADDLN